MKNTFFSYHFFTHYWDNKLIVALCLFVLGFLPQDITAQRGMRFEHITTDEGLSQNTPNVFFQDSRGLLWIGTQDGLNMYDGIRFYHYKREVDNPASLSDNLVHSLTEDSLGNIWIGTEGGLNVFDFAEQTFKRYLNNPIDERSLASNNVLSLHRDKNNDIWVGTDEGLCKFVNDGKYFERYQTPVVGQNVVNCFLEDDEYLWVGSNAGIAAFDRTAKKYIKQGFDSRSISGMAMDNQGNIWAGGVGGLYKRTFVGRKDTPLDVVQNRYLSINDVYKDSRGLIWLATTDNSLQYLRPWWKVPKLRIIRSRKTNPQSLSSTHVLTIFEDKAGIFWIGTNGRGIDKYDRHRIKFNSFNASNVGLQDNTVRSILEDKHGILWVGSVAGLNKLTEESETASNIGLLSGKSVFEIFEDTSTNQVWVGTEKSGIYIFDNSKASFGARLVKRFDTNSTKGLLSNTIRVIYKDRKGTIWVGTDKGGLSKYLPSSESFHTYTKDPNVPSSLSNNRIRGVYEDKEGVLWVSTYGGGLNKMDRENNIFSAYKTDVNDSHSISTNRVYPVYEDRQGNFWVLTYGGGLNKLDRNSGKFIHLTEEDGLPNNVIYGILEDNEGYLWLSTNKGLSKFDPQNQAFTNYGIQDGLQANEYNANAYDKGKDGKMYFGGINGFNYFYPDSIRGNSYIAPVMFMDFQLNNKSVGIGDSSVLNKHISLTEEIILSPDQNSFSFLFASLHYSFAERNEYAYKLEGFDEDWIQTGRGEAQYTNLDAGEYVFKVKGSNSDGVWNPEPISVRIKITERWYNTTLARIIGLLLIILVLYAIYKWRIWRIERKRRLLEEKVNQRTLELSKEKQRAEEQKNLFEYANKKIMDSIRYAQRIQDAIIPSDEEMKSAFGEYFVLFKPRDIVSGDFYWAWQKNGTSQLAVVDCTGHGVPGAIMSVVGFAMLEQTTKVRQIEKPDEVLRTMNEGIVDWLKQNQGNVLQESGKVWKSRDGMDMTFVSINRKLREITFAGAKNPIFIVDEEVRELKGSKFSIGGTLLHNKQKTFESKSSTLKNGTMIYLTTDGFLDQFGGRNNKKYGKKRFKEILLKIKDLPLAEQKEKIQKSLNHWQGMQRQIDDILVVGIRVQ